MKRCNVLCFGLLCISILSGFSAWAMEDIAENINAIPETTNTEQTVELATKDFFNGFSDLNPTWVESITMIDTMQELQALLNHFTLLKQTISDDNALTEHLLRQFELSKRGSKDTRTLIAKKITDPAVMQRIKNLQSLATDIVQRIILQIDLHNAAMDGNVAAVDNLLNRGAIPMHKTIETLKDTILQAQRNKQAPLSAHYAMILKRLVIAQAK